MKKHSTVIALLLLVVCTGHAQRTVEDELGRKVVVPNTPHRVISLTPSITDTLYAMGAGADIVGISNYTKYPEEAKKKPSVGEPLNPSLETIVSLHPDLVLAVQDMNSAETAKQLDKLGIPVFTIEPHGISGIYASIANLGNVLNRKQDADHLIARLRSREQAVRNRVKNKDGPRVFFVVWPDPIITAGKNAFITEIIEIAGGKSITDDLPQDWPQISLEAVVARKPDSLIFATGQPFSLDDLKKKPGWSNLEALKANRVFYTDERILHPSPVAFDALEDLANQFYPPAAH